MSSFLKKMEKIGTGIAYRWCAVLDCKSTSISTPDKLFINVPQSPTERRKWLELARRDPNDFSSKTVLYVCEDHFDLPNDMTNYLEYKLMGSVKKIRMREGCYPSKFQIQCGNIERQGDKNQTSAVSTDNNSEKTSVTVEVTMVDSESNNSNDSNVDTMDSATSTCIVVTDDEGHIPVDGSKKGKLIRFHFVDADEGTGIETTYPKDQNSNNQVKENKRSSSVSLEKPAVVESINSVAQNISNCEKLTQQSIMHKVNEKRSDKERIDLEKPVTTNITTKNSSNFDRFIQQSDKRQKQYSSKFVKKPGLISNTTSLSNKISNLNQVTEKKSHNGKSVELPVVPYDTILAASNFSTVVQESIKKQVSEKITHSVFIKKPPDVYPTNPSTPNTPTLNQVVLKDIQDDFDTDTDSNEMEIEEFTSNDFLTDDVIIGNDDFVESVVIDSDNNFEFLSENDVCMPQVLNEEVIETTPITAVKKSKGILTKKSCLTPIASTKKSIKMLTSTPKTTVHQVSITNAKNSASQVKQTSTFSDKPVEFENITIVIEEDDDDDASNKNVVSSFTGVAFNSVSILPKNIYPASNVSGTQNIIRSKENSVLPSKPKNVVAGISKSGSNNMPSTNEKSKHTQNVDDTIIIDDDSMEESSFSMIQTVFLNSEPNVNFLPEDTVNISSNLVRTIPDKILGSVIPLASMPNSIGNASKSTNGVKSTPAIINSITFAKPRETVAAHSLPEMQYTTLLPSTGKAKTTLLPSTTKANSTLLTSSTSKANTALLASTSKANTPLLPSTNKTNATLLPSTSKVNTNLLLTTSKANKPLLPVASKATNIKTLCPQKPKPAILRKPLLVPVSNANATNNSNPTQILGSNQMITQKNIKVSSLDVQKKNTSMEPPPLIKIESSKVGQDKVAQKLVMIGSKNVPSLNKLTEIVIPGLQNKVILDTSECPSSSSVQKLLIPLTYLQQLSNIKGPIILKVPGIPQQMKQTKLPKMVPKETKPQEKAREGTISQESEIDTIKYYIPHKILSDKKFCWVYMKGRKRDLDGFTFTDRCGFNKSESARANKCLKTLEKVIGFRQDQLLQSLVKLRQFQANFYEKRIKNQHKNFKFIELDDIIGKNKTTPQNKNKIRQISEKLLNEAKRKGKIGGRTGKKVLENFDIADLYYTKKVVMLNEKNKETRNGRPKKNQLVTQQKSLPRNPSYEKQKKMPSKVKFAKIVKRRKEISKMKQVPKRYTSTSKRLSFAERKALIDKESINYADLYNLKDCFVTLTRNKQTENAYKKQIQLFSSKIIDSLDDFKLPSKPLLILNPDNIRTFKYKEECERNNVVFTVTSKTVFPKFILTKQRFMKAINNEMVKVITSSVLCAYLSGKKTIESSKSFDNQPEVM